MNEFENSLSYYAMYLRDKLQCKRQFNTLKYFNPICHFYALKSQINLARAEEFQHKLIDKIKRKSNLVCIYCYGDNGLEGIECKCGIIFCAEHELFHTLECNIEPKLTSAQNSRNDE